MSSSHASYCGSWRFYISLVSHKCYHILKEVFDDSGFNKSLEAKILSSGESWESVSAWPMHFLDHYKHAAINGAFKAWK